MSNMTPTPEPADRLNGTPLKIRLAAGFRGCAGRLWSSIRRGLSSLRHPKTVTSKIINVAIVAAGVEATLQIMDRFGGIEMVGHLIELL